LKRVDRIRSSLAAFDAAMSGEVKGALLAIASAAFLSVTFVASKQAMRDLEPLAFTPVWFAAASGWGVAFYWFQYGPVWPRSIRTTIWPITWIGLLNGAANFLFFTSIKLGDPTLVALFSRSETIYAVCLGAWLLGERLQRQQWLGAALTVAGAGAISFRAGPVVWLMLALTLLSNLFSAFSTLVAKRNIAAVPPLVLSIARTAFMVLGLGSIALVTGQLAWPDLAAWLWIISGAFFGPFFSYFLFYKSLRYLDLAKGAVFRAMQPLFVAIYSYFLFDTIITRQQFVGGLAMIAGVILMLWVKPAPAERKIT
jgi:drug/metabolite transporter (DMT)-like permease